MGKLLLFHVIITIVTALSLLLAPQLILWSASPLLSSGVFNSLLNSFPFLFFSSQFFIFPHLPYQPLLFFLSPPFFPFRQSLFKLKKEGQALRQWEEKKLGYFLHSVFFLSQTDIDLKLKKGSPQENVETS